jgi:acetolactate synthase regulatory subunit
MTGRLMIEFSAEEGAVSRLLGLIERRGFRVQRLKMGTRRHRGSIMVDVESRDPTRRMDVLSRQIGRLREVSSVSLSPPTTGRNP